MKTAALVTIVMAFIVVTHLQALAHGPLTTNKGKAVVWNSSKFPVSFRTDQGAFGAWDNAKATALVEDCFKVWQDVPAAAITFQNAGQLAADVNGANDADYLENTGDGINPIVFDSDGAIIDSYFGSGASDDTFGFAGSSAQGPYYVDGIAVLNGKFTLPPYSYSFEMLKATFAHEFGHFIGLDHCQINSRFVMDGSTENDQYVPTMFPTNTDDDTTLGDLNPDDMAGLTMLYPESSYLSAYGRIQGKVTWSTGLPVLGANVVAVNTGDESMAVFSSVSDYFMQGDGSYEMLVTPGAYRLFIEPVSPSFSGGSSVGPYADNSSAASFSNPVTRQEYSGTVSIASGQTAGSIDFIAQAGASTTTTSEPGTGCTADEPVDCGNGFCCPENTECGFGADEGYCISAGGPCAAEQVFGEKSREAGVLRDFRDRVLQRSAAGKKYTQLYYVHAGEAAAILSNNPDMRAQFKKVFFAVLPGMLAATNGNAAITINQQTAREINHLCEALAEHAGPGLRKSLEQLRQDIAEGKLSGKPE